MIFIRCVFGDALSESTGVENYAIPRRRDFRFLHGPRGVLHYILHIRDRCAGSLRADAAGRSFVDTREFPVLPAKLCLFSAHDRSSTPTSRPPSHSLHCLRHDARTDRSTTCARPPPPHIHLLVPFVTLTGSPPPNDINVWPPE